MPTKHGQHGTPLYNCWRNAIRRCTNPNHPYYENYGGRGIKVCERWRHSFATFRADIIAEIGEPPPADLWMSLDRWPNCDGDYEPGNVRWATPKQQRHNQRRPYLARK